MLLAASAVTLNACAASTSERPLARPDPVIETRTEVVMTCPAELLAALPPRPQPSSLAELTGNQPGMDWLTALLSHLGLVEDRLRDAAAQCPAQVVQP